MTTQIISTAITFVVSALLGYCLNMIKNYSNKDKNQEDALKCLLRSNITSKFYVYSEIGSIPQYEKQNLNYLAEAYYKMGGNSYVKEIVNEINKLPVK